MSSFLMTMQTDDDEGCDVQTGRADNVPRIGDTLYGPKNAPGPWLVTDVFWTKPFNEDGKMQKVTVQVRLHEKYEYADEGDIRPDYSAAGENR